MQINTRKPDSVNLVEIEKIEYDGEEAVYNMEVVDNHNFSISNGLIVHNCMDQLRYFCRTVLRNELKWIV